MRIELHTTKNDDRPVFISGNFNDWNAQSPSFKMLKINDGHYEFTFSDTSTYPYHLEYKYNRGGWDNEEADDFGSKTSNRIVIKNQHLITDFVPRWFNKGKSYPIHLLPKIEVVHQNFEIPQLNKTRRVTILLPVDYYENTRRYPVLYLQDGQNLYEKNAPFGTWGIDEKLAVLKEKGHGNIIVVAIDHGETERIHEFTPPTHINLGIGRKEGTKYLDFMANTLKPHIDANYRTFTQKEFTGIGGSSMGGLISLFGGILRPETFGRILVFSPSLWIYPDVYKEAGATGALEQTKLYIYAGGRESQTMVSNVQTLIQSINESPQNTEINLVVDPNGTHTESKWSVAFPEAVEWLFY